MTIIGVLDKDKYGEVQKPRVIYETKTAPSSDLTITATSTTTIQVPVASEYPHKIKYAGIESISGLPSDVKVQSFSFDKTNKLLTIVLYNSSTSDVTVTANSIEITILSIA